MPFGELRSISISGADVDFCTVTPWFSTALGSCELACEARICVRIWSVLAAESMLKSTVRFIFPLLEFNEYM